MRCLCSTSEQQRVVDIDASWLAHMSGSLRLPGPANFAQGSSKSRLFKIDFQERPGVSCGTSCVRDVNRMAVTTHRCRYVRPFFLHLLQYYYQIAAPITLCSACGCSLTNVLADPPHVGVSPHVRTVLLNHPGKVALRIGVVLPRGPVCVPMTNNSAMCVQTPSLTRTRARCAACTPVASLCCSAFNTAARTCP